MEKGVKLHAAFRGHYYTATGITALQRTAGVPRAQEAPCKKGGGHGAISAAPHKGGTTAVPTDQASGFIKGADVPFHSAIQKPGSPGKSRQAASR